MGGGFKKIPYPKHVWSPAGGWYANPPNWKRNTAILGLGIFFIDAWIFWYSCQIEHFWKRPEPGRFYFSKIWSKQMRGWAEEDRINAEKAKAAGEAAGITQK